MRRLLLIPVCFVALLVPVAVLAGGSENGFDGVVRTIETKYHVHATRIPFLGLISFVSRKATNGGVSNLHIAEFEYFSPVIDGEELNQMVETKLGAGWERIIRETSRRTDSTPTDANHEGEGGNTQTLIFIRPEGARMGLFVLDEDGRNLDVVQVSVNPDHLSESIDHYEHHHHPDDVSGSNSQD
jgi:hypothetical protein